MNKELVLRAKQQDKDAFVELIDQQRLSMYKVAKTILKKEEDIADAIQETILDCWEKLYTLRKSEYFRTWLIRILINNCNTIYHQRAKVILDNEIILEETTDADYISIEWQEMLHSLNEKQRIAVELYYVEQFKVREIANILGISQSAVKGRLSNARKALEKYYSMGTQDRKIFSL